MPVILLNRQTHLVTFCSIFLVLLGFPNDNKAAGANKYLLVRISNDIYMNAKQGKVAEMPATKAGNRINQMSKPVPQIGGSGYRSGIFGATKNTNRPSSDYYKANYMYYDTNGYGGHEYPEYNPSAVYGQGNLKLGIRLLLL